MNYLYSWLLRGKITKYNLFQEIIPILSNIQEFDKKCL